MLKQDEIEPSYIFEKIKMLLSSARFESGRQYSGEIQVLHTQRVVLLKTYDKKNQVNVDLCINKVFEVYNSKLMQTYCKINPDFQKLALLLKNWNRTRFPNHQTRLNSFSIVLMLLAYMQSKN